MTSYHLLRHTNSHISMKSFGQIFSKSLIAATMTFSLYSCCEPEVRDSAPQIFYSSYQDTFIYDLWPEAVDARDSGWYPIYTFDIKNRGTEADTFTIRMTVDGWGFRDKIYIDAGQTITYSTPGPIPDTAAVRAQDKYYAFFRRDTSFLPIYEVRPTIRINYGEVFKGDEGCNTPSSELQVDPTLFR
jgi:hypothetical protein